MISDETWYKTQAPRWDALRKRGWEFDTPQPCPLTVGLVMAHGRLTHSAVFRVPRRLGPEEISTRMLRLCELFAGEAEL